MIKITVLAVNSKSKCTIPTEQIISDIEITEKEIKDYIDMNRILMHNQQENRVKIYFNEGNILKREEFINKLKQILEERKKPLL